MSDRGGGRRTQPFREGPEVRLPLDELGLRDSEGGPAGPVAPLVVEPRDDLGRVHVELRGERADRDPPVAEEDLLGLEPGHELPRAADPRFRQDVHADLPPATADPALPHVDARVRDEPLHRAGDVGAAEPGALCDPLLRRLPRDVLRVPQREEVKEDPLRGREEHRRIIRRLSISDVRPERRSLRFSSPTWPRARVDW